MATQLAVQASLLRHNNSFSTRNAGLRRVSFPAQRSQSRSVLASRRSHTLSVRAQGQRQSVQHEKEADKQLVLTRPVVPDHGPRLDFSPAPSVTADDEDVAASEELQRLRALRARLRSATTLQMKMAVVDTDDRVRSFFYDDLQGRRVMQEMSGLSEQHVYALKCVAASGQEHILRVGDRTAAMRTALLRLATVLERMDSFYDCLGGIVGYQVAALELIQASAAEAQSTTAAQATAAVNYKVPPGVDLSENRQYATKAAGWGIDALPRMAEIYPLGGAGDRLGLVDEVTGEALPVALLNYTGRSLLEGLIRDVQAREYLFYKLRGRQVITPIAIMTSEAKSNHQHVCALLEENRWFGRGRDAFKLFTQPMVPTIAADSGQWVAQGPLEPLLKPGGHGVIWKLARDEGVMDWFAAQGRQAAVVRQISNPMAGSDTTLLALSGIGRRFNRTFGFASCHRNVGNAEGVNVLVEKRTPDGSWQYGISNIEYTEFEKLGIPDTPVEPGSLRSRFPANTNVLYVNLAAVQKVLSSGGPEDNGSHTLPGMIMNLKKTITFEDHLGNEQKVRGGRLECTMQNIADCMMQTFPQRLPAERHSLDLNTFLVYNERRRVTSSAKKKRAPGSLKMHQTPDGSFLDLMRNAHDLLTRCNMQLPEMPSVERYLESGPPFIFLFNPALGPLWDIVEQKIRGGKLAFGAEVQLEIAELDMENVQVEGTLIVKAGNVTGHTTLGRPLRSNGLDLEDTLRSRYSENVGRCRLRNVVVKNAGIDWENQGNSYWQHRVHRTEALSIMLHGTSEFEAVDIELSGPHSFEVPHGYRMRVVGDSSSAGGIKCQMIPLPLRRSGEPRGTWRWQHTLARGRGMRVELRMLEMRRWVRRQEAALAQQQQRQGQRLREQQERTKVLPGSIAA
eukprot:jgi/Chlat1/6291/Chrsp44S05785